MLTGYDYEELANEWCLYLPDYLDDFSDISTADWIRMYLISISKLNRSERVIKKIANDIRKHCRLMATYGIMPDRFIWCGFSKTEDDRVVIQYFSRLIDFAWT